MKQMPNCQKYKPTYILIAINIAVYIYTSILSGNFLVTKTNVAATYGQFNIIVFQGYYYQLITSIFVHATLLHIAGNMIFLFIFGTRSEKIFSLPQYLAIYLLGGLVGNLLTLFLMDPYTISLGASGAIFAIFGACIIYERKAYRQSLLGAIVYVGFMLLISTGIGVNNWAHLGGLGLGLLIGYLLASRRKQPIEYNISYGYSNPDDKSV
jgi:rhomboid protease GluP